MQAGTLITSVGSLSKRAHSGAPLSLSLSLSCSSRRRKAKRETRDPPLAVALVGRSTPLSVTSFVSGDGNARFVGYLISTGGGRRADGLVRRISL